MTMCHLKWFGFGAHEEKRGIYSEYDTRRRSLFVLSSTKSKPPVLPLPRLERVVRFAGRDNILAQVLWQQMEIRYDLSPLDAKKAEKVYTTSEPCKAKHYLFVS